MKKYLLLIFSLILTTVILSFGQAAYNKEINTPKPNSTPNGKVIQTPEPKITKSNQNTTKQKSSPTNTPSTENKPRDIEDAKINNSSNSLKPIDNTSGLPSSAIEQKLVTLEIEQVGNWQIPWQENDTAWEITKRASQKYIFPVSYQIFDFGIYVNKIGSLETHNHYYWALYQNNNYAQVGAQDLKINTNDIITWKFEQW